MRLTVAKRIIAGFSALTFLLILGGVISLFGLADIETNQQTISQQAVPKLNTANQLSLLLSKLETQLVHSLNANSSERLSQYRQRFNLEQRDFEQKLTSEYLSSDSQKAQNLRALFVDYTSTTEQFFAERKQVLALRDEEAEALERLTELSDEAGGLLLDLSDEAADGALIIEMSSRLEELLSSLVSVSTDLFDELDEEKADNLFAELENLQQRVSQRYARLTQEHSVELVDKALSDEIDLAIDEVFELLLNKRSPNQLHRMRLDALSRSIKLSQQSFSLQNQLQLQLENVLKQTLMDVSERQSSLSSTVSNTFTLIIGGTLLSLVIAIVVAYATIRSILRPLGSVNAILHTIAQGDLTQSLDESGQDEFSELSKNVNAVVASLRSLIESITKHAAELADAAEETSGITQQTTQGIAEQRQQTDQAATATTQLDSSAEQVSSNANDTLVSVQQANDEAQHARSSSQQTKQQIEALAAELGQVSNIIHRFAEHSAQIGSVLDVIRTIAEQTNLLALNAAIEAARAGEQGRGFAVVADEVRALASRTQSSTVEIQSMIEKLQQGASEAVDSMESSSVITAQCVDKSDETDTALVAITSSVRAINEQSHQISIAAKEQKQVSSEIHHKLVQVVDVAERTSEGAEQTAQASQDVARLSRALQVSVSQFKL